MSGKIDPLFVSAAPKPRQSWHEVIPEFKHGRVGAEQYVQAFERNCPGIRLSRDEREELWRLFSVAIRG